MYLREELTSSCRSLTAAAAMTAFALSAIDANLEACAPLEHTPSGKGHREPASVQTDGHEATAIPHPNHIPS